MRLLHRPCCHREDPAVGVGCGDPMKSWNCNEFQYRHNTGQYEDVEKFGMTLGHCECRLTYQYSTYVK